jgi:glycosyltransferase involved in cell wall biosynthesis
MKILFVHNFYQQFGGEDSVAQVESRMLKERGQDLLVWTRHNDEIKNYNALQKIAFFPRTISSRKTVSDVRDAVRQFRPDVAYLHNIYPLISPSIYDALREEGVPSVQVLHDFRPFCSNGWFYIHGKVCEKCKPGNHIHAVLNRCYRDSFALSALYAATMQYNRWAGLVDKVDAFICLTGFFKQKAIEAGVPESKIFVRPNFITAPQWDTPAQTGDYAVYVGRLSNEKGVQTLLRGFQQLPDVPLKVVGTGPIEAELKAYAEQHKLTNVEFVGFKSGDEKWDLVRRARFAVVSSEWYENFPISVLEHFAASKPVVASRIGGLPFIIEEGKTGYLYEAGNADDLAAKVRQIIADPAKAAAMGSLGRKLVETRYGPEEGYNNLINILEKVIAQ